MQNPELCIELLQLIDRGSPYRHLNRSYIIFIFPFDIYEKGRHIYTFENRCREDLSLSMGDETVKIFLNALGKLDDVSPRLKAFLDYVAGRKPEDNFVRKLEMAVKEAKKNWKWRHEYMTLLMRDQENLEKGKIYGMILAYKKLNMPEEAIIKTLEETYSLAEEEAKAYVQEVQ